MLEKQEQFLSQITLALVQDQDIPFLVILILTDPAE